VITPKPEGLELKTIAMSSHRQILYHIVFGTKYHKPAININHKKELYKYIWGIIKNKNCTLYQINGSTDHIHILSDLHPSVSLANFVKDIKVASSIWMKDSGFLPDFKGWAEGYGVFTYAYRDKILIIKYIKNQEQHHKKVSFKDEYIAFLKEYGVDFDERYL
jgi:REP element-mobilizing transposase RayT